MQIGARYGEYILFNGMLLFLDNGMWLMTVGGFVVGEVD